MEESTPRAKRFRRATWIAITTMIVFDLVCVGVLVLVPAEDPLARLVATIGFITLSIALLMPLAQMWLAKDFEESAKAKGVAPSPILIINGVAGPVRVRLAEGSFDVELGAAAASASCRFPQTPRAWRPSSFAGELVTDLEQSTPSGRADDKQDYDAAAPFKGDVTARPFPGEASRDGAR